MEEAIKNFGKQFEYIPEIINKESLKSYKDIVVLGMGGSHLASGIANTINPDLNINIHRDYGLPKTTSECLIIASSYSGNTEEVIDGLNLAISKGLNTSVISVGGKLIEMAKEHNLPYIQIPNIGIQPRSALGFSLVALAHLLNDSKLLLEIESIKGKINPENFKEEGKKLSEDIRNSVPIVYSSRRNLSIAYNWKIKLNETGKIPAFYNIFPELNHNEMTGFDINSQNKALSEKFVIIFLTDKDDHSQIQKRMNITKKLYEERGIRTIMRNLEGSTPSEKIFSSLILADWTAFYTAELYGSEANEVPMVEEFKKLVG